MANLIRMRANWGYRMLDTGGRMRTKRKPPLLFRNMLATIALVVGVCLLAPQLAFAGDPNIFTDNVGIGLTEPTGPLHVAIGTTAPQALFVHASTGNIGIGTTNPTRKLYLSGDLGLTGAIYDTNSQAGTSGQLLSSTGTAVDWIDSSAVGDNLGNHTATQNILLGSYWLSGDGGNEGVFVKADGNVGIGTTSPATRLDVSGTITATGWSGGSITTLGSTIEESELNLTDLTTANASTTAHGFLKKLDNSATNFMNGQGNWAVPAGTGANTALSNLASVAINTSLLPGTDNSIDLGSAAKTFKNAYLTGNVGIGTTSPTGLLHIGVGTTAPQALFVHASTGNVGIGTTSPGYKLQVNGTLQATDLYSGDGTQGGTATTGGLAFKDGLYTSGTLSYTETDPIVGAINGIIKANGAGAISAAVANTDYEPALTDSASLATTLTDETGSGLAVFATSPTFSGSVTMPGTGIWNSDGNVGIGTTSPNFELTLGSDKGMLATGTFGIGVTMPTLSDGAVMYWYPKKGAFRAGGLYNNNWNDANVGNCSVAFGNKNTASGIGSFAMGAEYASATAGGSIALGAFTSSEANYAIGMGYNTNATGIYAIGIGNDADASGSSSLAMGQYLLAGSASNTIVLGKGVDANNRLVNNITNSLMIGFNSTIPTLYVGPSSGAGTTGNVGIGTTGPTGTLHVAIGTTAPQALFIHAATGNVGIGTTSPATKLDVNGVITATGGNSTQWNSASTSSHSRGHTMASTDDHTDWPSGLDVTELGYVNGVTSALQTQLDSRWDALSDMALAQGNLYVGNASNQPAANSSIYVKTDGNVGIGTTGPGAKLQVSTSVGEPVEAIFRDSGSSGRIRIASLAGFTAGLELYEDTTQRWYINNYGSGDMLYFNDASDTPVMCILQGGNVGIGTTNPTGLLHIGVGTTAPQALFVHSTTGNVGIGTTSPATKLDVNGIITATDGNSTQWNSASTSSHTRGHTMATALDHTDWPSGLDVTELGYLDGVSSAIQTQLNAKLSATGTLTGLVQSTASGLNYFTGGNLGIGTNSPTGLLHIGIGTTAPQALFVHSSTGNVGIGTTGPGSKLHIAPNSNTQALRIQGGDGTTELVDIYVGGAGEFVVDLTVGSDPDQYIDLRPEDGDFGLVLRESDGTGTAAYANFYVVDAATDYMNIIVGASRSTTGLVVNASGNVGIGTTSPSGRLHVAIGTTAPQALFVHATSGNVGIGTTNPAEVLHVNGSIRGNQSGALRINTGTGYLDIGSKGAGWCHFYTDQTRFYFAKDIVIYGGAASSYTGQDFELRADYNAAASDNQLYLKTDGNVGIGTTSPATKLDVNGVITATGGNSTNWNSASTSSHTRGHTMASTDDHTDWPSGLDVTELGYVNGVTSALQTQLNAKAPTASPTFTGNVTMPGTGIWNSSGNVGIGTTGPTAKLEISGTSTISNTAGDITINAAGNIALSDDTTLLTGKKLVLDSDDVSNSYLVHNNANNYVSMYVDGVEVARFKP